MRWFRRNDARACLPVGERVYAIGDVHGEAGLLGRLLERIDTDSRARAAATVTLVLLGDVIDRGTESVALLRALYGQTGASLRLLKGNHEELLVASCRGEVGALDLRLQVGGRSTLRGFGIDAALIDADDPALIDVVQAAIDPALVDWVDQLPTSWSAGGYFLAHAGVRPGIALDRQRDDDLLWIREPFLSSRANHGKAVVHGHTIEPGIPRLGGNRIGLDTGGLEHRCLTALGLEGDAQWLIQECDADAAPAAPPQARAAAKAPF